MSNKTVAQRYIGTALYAGELLDEPLVQWLVHSDQPTGLGFPCFLPECRKLVMRTNVRRQAYYCDPKHARIALARKRRLQELLSRLRTELAAIPIGASGRPSTRRGRQLQTDLEFVLRVLDSYAGVSENDAPHEHVQAN